MVGLLFSNHRTPRLFTQAKSNFLRGDKDSLAQAEIQLQQVIRNDKDNEAAYIMLAEIAGKRKFGCFAVSCWRLMMIILSPLRY